MKMIYLSTENLCRKKGTGEYDKLYEEGVYNCAGCGTPLYKSSTKFDSGCGWPSFYEGFPGAINRSVSNFRKFIIQHSFFLIGWKLCLCWIYGSCNFQPDPDGRRTEITCAGCGGHLGHVTKGEGYKTPTDERHCVNSISVKFVPGNATTSIWNLLQILLASLVQWLKAWITEHACTAVLKPIKCCFLLVFYMSFCFTHLVGLLMNDMYQALETRLRHINGLRHQLIC